MPSDTLESAAAEYQKVFGHGVPVQVLRVCALTPGPLLLEIRQALALGRPVPGWEALSRAGHSGTTPA